MRGVIIPNRGWSRLIWLSGMWAAPLWAVATWLVPASLRNSLLISAGALVLAPIPAILTLRVYRVRHRGESEAAREEIEKLKSQLESVRYRTARLREELSAADRQARLSHQMTLLGQFTAGFLHEYNNPLAIVTNRIEILLEERKDDEALCTDLRQMLSETHYMANIAGTLLRALRKERSGETFEACVPVDELRVVVAALAPSAQKQGVSIALEPADVPRVNLPAHVVSEVARALISNALQALDGRSGGSIRVRLEPFHTVGAKVVMRVEDNGPGVPETMRPHLFEPFASAGSGRERLGLGLFLCASLLDTYDGTLRYESAEGGGACFVAELPPARFTRGQPYHWFVKGETT